jgi:adenine-specific DNA-methyltransferase
MPQKLDRARRLRREQTDVEKALWQALRSRQLDTLKFRRQHTIGPFIADFCCVKSKLIIELDGEQHALDTDADERRSDFLAQRGYRVLRFWNHEVLTNIQGVLERILESTRHHSKSPSSSPSPPAGAKEIKMTPSPYPGGRMG